MSSSSLAEQQIEKYEAWAQRLEETRAHYVRRRPTYVRALWGLMAFGYALFLVDFRAGLWGAFTTPFFSLCAYGMLRTRIWELSGEIDALRDEIEKLRSTLS